MLTAQGQEINKGMGLKTGASGMPRLFLIMIDIYLFLHFLLGAWLRHVRFALN